MNEYPMKEITKKMNLSVFYALASVLSLIAMSIVTTNSILFVHKPEVPQELRK
ncbi:cyclic lactone autoinducer peptide [Paenibacillus sp. sgz500958]|uniref:cyclic lactone autoinducer peptide n=1 Tax=Paenibacillus sp. sgz500958 TaxID=3242475 RepID=UPI0036D3E053